MSRIPEPVHYVVDPHWPHLGGNIDGGDPRTYCPEAWAFLVRAFGVRTVYDVGCGQGHALSAFRELGCSVLGLDGLPANVAAAARHGPVLTHDLTAGPMPVAGIDLVWCCEVVEHIDEHCLGHLLETICCGRVLAMTHAVPGQDGWHHVNCRDWRYWVDAVEFHGFRWLPGHTAELKSLAPGTFPGQSGLVFMREDP